MRSPNTPAAVTTSPIDPQMPFEDAYALVLPQARVLEARELSVLNVDVRFAAGRVLSAMSKLRTLTSELALLHSFDAGRLDALELSALALLHSHSRFTLFNRPFELKALRAEAIALRAQLKCDAAALVKRRLLPRSLLANLANTTGDRALAGDLMALYAAFVDDPKRYAGKTATTPGEIAQAASLASQLLCSLGERAASRFEATAAIAELRQRFFTVFIRHYNEVRSAVEFLRRNQRDADQFLPSLRGTYEPRRKEIAQEASAPAEPAPAESVEQGEAPARNREAASLSEHPAKPPHREGARHPGKGTARAPSEGAPRKASPFTILTHPTQPAPREGAGHPIENTTNRSPR